MNGDQYAFLFNSKGATYFYEAMYRITRNFRGSMASYYFVIKHSRLLMMDLRIMPVIEIIRHKTFAVVRKAAKSAKVSWHTVNLVDYISWIGVIKQIFCHVTLQIVSSI